MNPGDSKEKKLDKFEGLACPVPLSEYPRVLLAHGGGGKLSQQIIQKMIVPQFDNEYLKPLHDGAVFTQDGSRFAFSTDSYVVSPLFFPGGDIGRLAVHGTINDLAMCGARPLFLSAAFIIEEGFSMDDLWRVIVSMQEASARAGVPLVTGDTKVVDRGKGDGIFVNTSGIGVVPKGVNVTSGGAEIGDVVLVNGPLAVHGVAIMSVRQGLEFQTSIQSDTAPLHTLVEAMLAVSKNIHVLRDPTRGGLASSLNELADASKVGVEIEETLIPLTEPVKGACEILGLDPLYVANEGKLIAFVSPGDAEKVLDAMRKHPLGKESVAIGKVVADHTRTVVMKTRIGGSRVVDMMSGEQLPRIC